MLREDLYTPWFADKDWGFKFISGEYLDVVVSRNEIILLDNSNSNLDSNRLPGLTVNVITV